MPEEITLMKYMTTIGEREYLIEICDEHHVSVMAWLTRWISRSVGDQPVYSLLLNGQILRCLCVPG